MSAIARRTVLPHLAAVVGVAAVAGALWAWGYSGAWAQRAGRPELAVWGVRLAAVALFAGAQVVFGLLVLPGFFRQSRFESGYALACGLLGALAIGGAVVIGAAAW